MVKTVIKDIVIDEVAWVNEDGERMLRIVDMKGEKYYMDAAQGRAWLRDMKVGPTTKEN